MKLQFFKGDIAQFPADAIVLPANEFLREGSGASTAIFQAAGRKELTRVCKKIGHCDVGKAVPTEAFNLNARFIIHAVVPKWIDGHHNEYDLLCSAYLSSLYIADAMGCAHIAFPLLASGNNGFNLSLALEIALKTIKDFNGNSLQQASIILFGNRITDIVKEKGYDVTDVLATSSVNAISSSAFANQHGNFGKIAAGYGKVAQNMIEDALNKGLKWIQDPDNQKKVMNMGANVFLAILSAKGIQIKRK